MGTGKYTLHGVLAGAYKGKDIDERAMLYHASLDRGHTSLCKRVKPDSLADIYGTPDDAELTCEGCKRKVAKLGLSRESDAG